MYCLCMLLCSCVPVLFVLSVFCELLLLCSLCFILYSCSVVLSDVSLPIFCHTGGGLVGIGRLFRAEHVLTVTAEAI